MPIKEKSRRSGLPLVDVQSGAGVKDTQDLEGSALLEIPTVNPEGFTADRHSHNTKISWLTFYLHRPPRHELRRLIRVLVAEVGFHSVVKFCGNGLPTMTDAPNVVLDEAPEPICSPFNRCHVL